jgi:hypothetical protein
MLFLSFSKTNVNKIININILSYLKTFIILDK